MKLQFTKMQGAGNDFVVLDATRAPIELTAAQVQRLGDRRLGIGADQVLVVDKSKLPGVDFGYRIYNGFSGDEVEHCGNGARCFVRYVREHGLTDKTTVRVATVNNQLTLHWQPDGRVTVDMNQPLFRSRWRCCRWATRMP
jgi:diaminopimelate epimerase